MRNRALTLAIAAAVTGTMLVFSSANAGGDKDQVFKRALPPDAVKELIAREAKIIQEQASGPLDKAKERRIKMGGALIAAYTLTSLDGDSPEARAAGIKIVELVAKKGNPDEIKKLAASLTSIQLAKGKGEADLSKLPLDKHSLMDHLKTKDKDGDGLHPDLQSNIRLKGALNGGEEKIRALSMKKLMQAGLDKEAAELTLFGYRMAAIGELTYFGAPAPKAAKKDPAIWRKLSIDTRDAALDLADAAKKKDIEAVFKASNALNSACSQCHSDFRNK